MNPEPSFAAQLAQDLSPEDVRMVLDVFRADLDRLSGVMRGCAAAGDVTGFRRVAHSLAGAAGAVGAGALEEACRLAMSRGEIGPAQMPAVAGEIDQLCAAALVELAQYVGEGNP
jgi:HPt (histidine-containing phosphotransfer) domain-containing protein